MRSCAAVLGLTFLVITDLASIISLATPYWLEHSIGVFGLVGRWTFHGLWATCDSDQCSWVFEDGARVLSSAEWFKATQGLMSVGLGLALLALIVATLALCCQCHGCNYAGVVAGLLLLCFLCIGVAVALFGIKASQDFNAVVTSEDLALGQEYKYAWSFWLAAGASGMALITSIVYGCAGLSTQN
ncbi:uncharacterized protein LOC110451654 isoform X1 [Mizuhopecten yessoensis]|uniref:uncharacterized protein LOC110451654 isoform X1 n=1 Tax=Mizuhopecten yessoensis TaxID=6573 RepID=UPI000B45F7F7|nr:uncharacterized protein LOC110451654 isoform X1 [Mizuhopecten yessoensis]